jgi:hypothetical protein
LLISFLVHRIVADESGLAAFLEKLARPKCEGSQRF